MRAANLNRPLRLLVLPDKYLPDQCGGGAIYTDMCRGLAERGLDVTVRCPYPFYPEWTDKSGHNGWRVERYVDQGVKVERFGMFIPWRPRSVLQRMLLDLSLLASLCRSLHRSGRFDAVIAFCPHSGGVAFAALLKLLYRCPIYLNIQDLPADAAAAGGLVSGGSSKAILRAVQKFLFNSSDVWSSISPVMVERLVEIRRRDQPILVVPNWPHRSLVEQIQNLPSKVGRLPGQPIRLLYAGNIGAKQGLLDFCKLLHERQVAFDFRIHGEGAVASEVRDWVHKSGDGRFSFRPLLDEAGFVHALHETDLCVITEKSGSGASFFPSKAAAGMATGTPTLAISDPDSPLGREVRGYNLGPWLPWDSGLMVSELLASLPGRAEEFVTWQANALRRSRYYDRGRCLDLVEALLEEIIIDPSLSRMPAADTIENWATFGSMKTSSKLPSPTLSSRAIRRVRSLLWRTPL